MTTASERVSYKSDISEKTKKKAKKELNEDPSKQQKCLNELRALFNTRPDIKFRTDDAFLIRFLRAKKYETNRAFKTLVHYYEVRRQHKDIFINFVPSAIMHVLETKMHFISDKWDVDGRRVIVFQIDKWDVKQMEATEIIRSVLMLLEMLLEEEESQVNGVVVVADASGLTMSHVTKMGPSHRVMMDVIQNALPLRFKAMHFVNEPKIIDAALALVRPFMSDKLKKRLQFHGEEFASLHKQIPSSILPAEYGGAVAEFDNKDWREILLGMEDKFIENNKYGFPKTADTLGGTGQGRDAAGGLTGSFKKLDV
ncbi:alpha-tocopherol transfer protein-like [Saccoglossus kowalevskii]|uniref:Alpha-tocopherol transfer protein-like n=1 Tax=Saccoglossus kowalevskii TaxID=10224 RepID=A0ABM0MM12_SACKO|nr:PREDICTED: alpha-tocopherol transfer protein-like [Saccoglossus kowalevskii]